MTLLLQLYLTIWILSIFLAPLFSELSDRFACLVLDVIFYIFGFILISPVFVFFVFVLVNIWT